MRRLAASALGKLRAIDASIALLDALEAESGPQVRQYMVKALGAIHRALPDEVARVLQRISADPDELPYVRCAAESALRLHR